MSISPSLFVPELHWNEAFECSQVVICVKIPYPNPNPNLTVNILQKLSSKSFLETPTKHTSACVCSFSSLAQLESHMGFSLGVLPSGHKVWMLYGWLLNEINLISPLKPSFWCQVGGWLSKHWHSRGHPAPTFSRARRWAGGVFQWVWQRFFMVT